MKSRVETRLSFEALESRDVPSTVTGSVYVDANNNGLRDSGEVGIPNVTIKLVNPGGSVVATTTTNSNGDYAFYSVWDGLYKVVEVQPTGYTDGLDSAGGVVIPGSNLTDSIAINVVCMEDVHCIDFGELETTGHQGLTPGFWKNNADKWGASAWFGYTPTQTVSGVFGSSFGSLGSLTLEQALGTGGGGINALLRHSVAAVLNAASPNVDYPLTTTQIISGVQSAVAGGDTAIEQFKNQLDTYNNYGANLDQHGNVI